MYNRKGVTGEYSLKLLFNIAASRGFSALIWVLHFRNLKVSPGSNLGQLNPERIFRRTSVNGVLFNGRSSGFTLSIWGLILQSLSLNGRLVARVSEAALKDMSEIARNLYSYMFTFAHEQVTLLDANSMRAVVEGNPLKTLRVTHPALLSRCRPQPLVCAK